MQKLKSVSCLEFDAKTFCVQLNIFLLIVLEVTWIGCLVILYIAKKLNRIFRRLESIVMNFFNYRFGDIGLASLDLQCTFFI